MSVPLSTSSRLRASPLSYVTISDEPPGTCYFSHEAVPVRLLSLIQSKSITVAPGKEFGIFQGRPIPRSQAREMTASQIDHNAKMPCHPQTMQAPFGIPNP